MGSHFHGSIDEIRIYDRALSADEVERLYNFEKFSSTSEFYLSFDNVTDFTGKTEGVLEFVDENSFKVVLDDDNSSGSFGGQANGVHITNLDYGNSKDGHSTDFVIGAFNSSQSGKNFHSSGIVGSFSKGVHFLSIEDTDDDNTNKILFALDKEGNVIGQTQPFTRTFGVLSSETLDDELIYGFEFDTLSGSDGGSNDDTFFTIDNLRVVYADNYQPKDLNSTATLTIAENQPPGTTVGEFNATDPDANATLTYHLVSGVGDGNNSLFTLDLNGTLKTATVFDFESNASTYSIRVQARDEYNASVEENFTVTLLDIFESADIQIFSRSGVNLNLVPGDYKLKYLSGGYLCNRYRTHTSFEKSVWVRIMYFFQRLLFSIL